MNRETQVIYPGFPPNLFYFSGKPVSGQVTIEVKSLEVPNKTRFTQGFELPLEQLDIRYYKDITIFGYLVRFCFYKETTRVATQLHITAEVILKPDDVVETKRSIKGLVLPMDADEQLFATVTLNY